jgi:LacI family transcriptional regulator
VAQESRQTRSTHSPQPAQRFVSLKDVAERAGVDASTVSRVLRGDTRKPVRAETRERVLQAATALSYRPNSVARSLRTRKTEAIGLVIPDAGNPGFAEIFKGVQTATEEAGWHVIVVEGRAPARAELGWERLVLEGRVDGLLVLTSRLHDPVVQRVARSGVPLVLVNRRCHGITGSVVVNDAQGAEVAVEHFVALGHRRIGHIAGPPDLDTGKRRLDGFRAAMHARGLRLRADWLPVTDYTEAGGAAAARTLLATLKDGLPTALYVASFLSGIGAMQVFRQAGLRIPHDLSVIVSDELALAAHTDPPLTTVAMPVTRMGEVATRMLLGALAHQPVSDIMLPEEPRLVMRATAAPPLSLNRRTVEE